MKDKCDSTGAHRRHLAANGRHENKRKIYCTNVHLRIIEILITLMYKLRAVTAAVTVGQGSQLGFPADARLTGRAPMPYEGLEASPAVPRCWSAQLCDHPRGSLRGGHRP